MSSVSHLNVNSRILILAPFGADARNASSVLTEAKYEPEICGSIAELCYEIEKGCAVIVITEEAISYSTHQLICTALDRQPTWSDIPMLLITSGGKMTAASHEAVQLLGSRSNVTLIERPLRVATLVASVKSALRARQRQYEIRDLLNEREELLTSLEQRVLERTVKLQETVEELEAFSYSVSHDLRSPLRVLQGYAEVLQSEYSAVLDPQAAKYLERIQRASARMDQLTRDLLIYSRTARSQLVLGPVDLDPLLNDVVDQYPSVSAARAHIQIKKPLGTVIGHGPSLIQCFSNLIENALKFVPANTTPDVQIYGQNSNGRVRVSIQDNGIGIDPAYHPKIFEIFERLHTNDIPGTGIGLAIVKKAVTRMGGSVHLTSALNQGSTFGIELESAG